jgi:hypothetical protein
MKREWLLYCNGLSLVHLSYMGERQYNHWVTVILVCIMLEVGVAHSRYLGHGGRKQFMCTRLSIVKLHGAYMNHSATVLQLLNSLSTVVCRSVARQ